MTLDFNSTNHCTVYNLTGVAVTLKVSVYGKDTYLQAINGNVIEQTFKDTNSDASSNLIVTFKNWDLAIERSTNEMQVEVVNIAQVNGDPYGVAAAATTAESRITAADLTTLKTRINNEAARRNKGPAPIAKRVTVTPTAGNSMTASDYNNFAAPVGEANSLVLNVTAGDYAVGNGTILASGMGSYTYLQNAVAILEGYTDVTGVSTGCQGSCTGLCSSACTGACIGCTSCQGGCTSCTGCSTGCGSGCTNACSGGCGSSCTYSCGQNCTHSCGKNCTNSCGAACTKTCGTNCTATCGGNCSGCTGCSSGCQGCAGCSNACKSCGTSCTGCSGCGGSCSVGCGGGCSGSCGDCCTDGYSPYDDYCL